MSKSGRDVPSRRSIRARAPAVGHGRVDGDARLEEERDDVGLVLLGRRVERRRAVAVRVLERAAVAPEQARDAHVALVAPARASRRRGRPGADRAGASRDPGRRVAVVRRRRQRHRALRQKVDDGGVAPPCGDVAGRAAVAVRGREVLRGERRRQQVRDDVRAALHACVGNNRWFGTSRPNVDILELGQNEVDSADFWTDRFLSSSSRSRAEELVSKSCRICLFPARLHAGDVERAAAVAVARGAKGLEQVRPGLDLRRRAGFRARASIARKSAPVARRRVSTSCFRPAASPARQSSKRARWSGELGLRDVRVRAPDTPGAAASLMQQLFIIFDRGDGGAIVQLVQQPGCPAGPAEPPIVDFNN